MLFRKLHLQLTGLCALITASILTVFSFAYLTLSEHSMRENHALVFENRFDTLSAGLEQSSVLTDPYLLRAEQSNDCLIFLWDNGTPLFFNQITSHDPYGETADAICQTYLAKREEHPLGNPVFYPFVKTKSGRTVQAGIRYLFPENASTAQKRIAVKENKGLLLLVLSDHARFDSRIFRQRALFFALSLAGCVLLTLFSYLFTSKMLRPLRENQEKQLAFIAGASHELRTPLAVIVSAADAKPPHFEETVKAEALRMGKLVDEMLLLSGMERGMDRFAFSSLRPDTFLLDFYERTENYVKSSDRTYTLSLPPREFPEILADGDKLCQLLEILLHNAVSYTQKGGSITLSLSMGPGHFVCFQVADNGIGLTDDQKGKIFERFYRVENAHSSKEHFGLGLCIAKEIADAHKGRITVSDTPGGGCTFQCMIPVRSF